MKVPALRLDDKFHIALLVASLVGMFVFGLAGVEGDVERGIAPDAAVAAVADVTPARP